MGCISRDCPLGVICANIKSVNWLHHWGWTTPATLILKSLLNESFLDGRRSRTLWTICLLGRLLFFFERSVSGDFAAQDGAVRYVGKLNGKVIYWKLDPFRPRFRNSESLPAIPSLLFN